MLLDAAETAIQDLKNPNGTEYPFPKGSPLWEITLEKCMQLKDQLTIPELKALSAGTGTISARQLCQDESYASAAHQNQYHLFYQCTVHYIATILTSTPPENLSLPLLMHMIGQLRRGTAEYLDHEDCGYFGLWRSLHREGICCTPITSNNRYQRYLPKIVEKIHRSGQPIAKTSISLKKWEKREVILSECEQKTEKCAIIRNIAKGQEIEMVLESLQNKMQEVMKTERSSRSEFMKKLADIHWCLAQLTPFMRGSAATTEILIQALCAAKGYPIPRLSGSPNRGSNQLLIFSDLEALTQSHKEFVRNYETMTQLLIVV